MTHAVLMNVVWQPAFDAGATLLLAAAVAVVVAWRAWREARGGRWAVAIGPAALRLLAIAALAVSLLGPARLRPASADGEAAERPRLAVLLDASASMARPDAPGGVADESRYAFAVRRWLGGEAERRLREAFDVSVHAFDRRVRRIGGDASGVSPTGGATRLASAVRAVAAELPADRGAAMLLLSDGRSSAGHGGADEAEAAGRAAGRRGVRVHAVPIGGSGVGPDIAVEASAAPARVFVGESAAIEVRVRSAERSGASVAVRVAPGGGAGASASGGALDRRVVELGADGASAFSVPVRFDRPGFYTYEVEAQGPPGELNEANNRAEVLVRVTDHPLRVLMLEGEPYWDTKFLAQALRVDPRFAVTQWSRLGEGRRERLTSGEADDAGGEQAATPPMDGESLRRYDAIVLGRSVDRLLPVEAARALRDYALREGGAVVLARGRPYGADRRAWSEAMSPIEPVTWKGGSRCAARLGAGVGSASHPAVASVLDAAGSIASAEALRWRGLAGGVKPGARVLLRAVCADRAEGGPAVVEMNAGRGRVVAVTGEGLWRWRLGGRIVPMTRRGGWRTTGSGRRCCDPLRAERSAGREWGTLGWRRVRRRLRWGRRFR